MVVVLLWAMHWVHLSADFPNDSPWMDYAKYTDEGWYGNAAMRALLFGHWFFPGDFNPAVALPVWPALEWLAFRVAGVSVDVARGLALVVFAANLVMSYVLLRQAGAGRRYCFGGVLLLAASMYLWAFSRLAILEPMLTFWILAAWLLAGWLPRLQDRQRMLALAGVGALSSIAVLTKTTAVFLLPATAALLVMAQRTSSTGFSRRLRAGLQDTAVVVACGATIWGAYFLWAVHAHALDYHYLFAANQWDPPHGLIAHAMAFWWAVHGLLWVSPLLVCLMLLLVVVALVASPAFRRLPLVWASLLAIAGYVFFIGWHNSPQPRYYMVLAYPVVFLTMLALRVITTDSRARLGAWPAVTCGALLGWIFAVNCYYSVTYALHPQYSLRAAAEGLTAYIHAHQESQPDSLSVHGAAFLRGAPLLMSISGDDITLFTGQPAICDDFGTDTLPDRIGRYRPQWYAEWNEVDPGTLDDIHAAGYRLEFAAHWHALDDEDRNDLVLYRMVRVPGSERAKDP
jgi:hypothetical protein